MLGSADTVKQRETRFWQSMVDKDREASMNLIADDCLLAGSTGVMRIDAQKYGELASGDEHTLQSFAFDNVEVVFPTNDVAIIAYTVHQIGDMGGEKMDLHCSDTSTWVRQNGDWKCAAHTEAILGHSPLTN